MWSQTWCHARTPTMVFPHWKLMLVWTLLLLSGHLMELLKSRTASERVFRVRSPTGPHRHRHGHRQLSVKETEPFWTSSFISHSAHWCWPLSDGLGCKGLLMTGPQWPADSHQTTLTLTLTLSSLDSDSSGNPTWTWDSNIWIWPWMLGPSATCTPQHCSRRTLLLVLFLCFSLDLDGHHHHWSSPGLIWRSSNTKYPISAFLL